ncbi:MAG: hypothetical protein ACRDRI_26165 [Pseudonocardiaceae bacterium]
MARRWTPIVVTTGVAALLAAAAVFTADRAACPTPGNYTWTPTGIRLIGGCLNTADLPVAPVAPPPTPHTPRYGDISG